MPLPLVGIADIAAMLGVSRQRADQLARQVGFPASVGWINRGAVWERKAIERWARTNGRTIH